MSFSPSGTLYRSLAAHQTSGTCGMLFATAISAQQFFLFLTTKRSVNNSFASIKGKAKNDAAFHTNGNRPKPPLFRCCFYFCGCHCIERMLKEKPVSEHRNCLFFQNNDRYHCVEIIMKRHVVALLFTLFLLRCLRCEECDSDALFEKA